MVTIVSQFAADMRLCPVADLMNGVSTLCADRALRSVVHLRQSNGTLEWRPTLQKERELLSSKSNSTFCCFPFEWLTSRSRRERDFLNEGGEGPAKKV